MENKKKRKKSSMKTVVLAEVEEKIEEKPIVKETPKVNFQAWFNKKLKKKQVRFWQDEGLLVFFKKQGLTEAEAEDLYDEALERF